MTFDFDLFVIGGGSGGVRAARIAAGEHGAKVGLAEESRMGGTCVIRGCVPKKLMVFASEAPAAAQEARGYGWTGAEAGWCEYDPTNACFVGADHVTIGYGRDYGDVAPVTGSMRLAGGQSTSHSVDILAED